MLACIHPLSYGCILYSKLYPKYEVYTANIFAQWNIVLSVTFRLLARLESFIFAWYTICYSDT